jgi:hypothetical protein
MLRVLRNPLGLAPELAEVRPQAPASSRLLRLVANNSRRGGAGSRLYAKRESLTSFFWSSDMQLSLGGRRSVAMALAAAIFLGCEGRQGM